MVTRKRARAGSAGPKRPRSRDRLATRQRVLAAVGRLLAREGFSSLGVNAVAREAGVDKVLIYRYFGGLEALLGAWGRTIAFGSGAPSAGDAAPASASAGDRAASFLSAYASDVRAHPEALEVMRWELVEDNVLTRQLAEVREAAGFAELRRLGLPRSKAKALDLPAMAAVLTAGILHLALRARSAPEWLGIPLRTGKGWTRIERAAGRLARAALTSPVAGHAERASEGEAS
jgi:AcrR family transcriptional regulator